MTTPATGRATRCLGSVVLAIPASKALTARRVRFGFPLSLHDLNNTNVLTSRAKYQHFNLYSHKFCKQVFE